MVGAARFELATSCTRNKRASQATLRPDPRQQKVPGIAVNCNPDFRRFAVRGTNPMRVQRHREVCGRGGCPGTPALEASPCATDLQGSG
jgi:hypothetical protein